MRASFSRPLARELARTLGGPLSTSVGGANGVSEAAGINPFNALSLTLLGTTYIDTHLFQSDPAPTGLRRYQFGDGQVADGPPWLTDGGDTNTYTFSGAGQTLIIGAATTPAKVQEITLDGVDGTQATGPLFDPRGFPILKWLTQQGKITGVLPASWANWPATLENLNVEDVASLGATLSGIIPTFVGAPFASTLLSLNFSLFPNITGALPSMASLTATDTSVIFDALGVTGNIPAPPPHANQYGVGDCAGITGYAGGAFPANLLNAFFSGNALTQAAVDALLAAAVAGGASGGTLALEGGTNATPSAAGLASKATLVGRGWTVTNA